jgi:hypothetical protein
MTVRNNFSVYRYFVTFCQLFLQSLYGPVEGFFNLFRHVVGLLWTSDRPVAKASTYTG